LSGDQDFSIRFQYLTLLEKGKMGDSRDSAETVLIALSSRLTNFRFWGQGPSYLALWDQKADGDASPYG